MSCFLETDIRERIQTSVDNTVNNPHRSKTFLFFCKQKLMFLLLKKYIFKNPKNSTTLVFFVVIFFVEADTKVREKYLAKSL